MLHETATWGKYAGAAYKFVGLAPDNTIQTFAEFYASRAHLDRERHLDRTDLERLSGAWYRRGRITESDLFKEYGLLAEKQTPIGLAIAALVDEGDPYLRTNLNRTEPPWPTGRPAFCRRAELPWYDPLAFLHEWPERSLTLPIHRATLHGDLNARNILIEIGQAIKSGPGSSTFRTPATGWRCTTRSGAGRKRRG